MYQHLGSSGVVLIPRSRDIRLKSDKGPLNSFGPDEKPGLSSLSLSLTNDPL